MGVRKQRGWDDANRPGWLPAGCQAPPSPPQVQEEGHACLVPSRPAQALGDLASALPRTPTAWASLAVPRVGLGELFWVWREGCGKRAMGDNDRAGAPPLASVH